jgi:mRNA-degrading endonuclease toxin of MazEF toxin-antitoxin module
VIPEGPVPASSVLVRPDHPEFPETGLARASLLRLDKLMTVSRTRIHRRLEHLGPVVMAEMDDRLRSAVGL